MNNAQNKNPLVYLFYFLLIFFIFLFSILAQKAYKAYLVKKQVDTIVENTLNLDSVNNEIDSILNYTKENIEDLNVEEKIENIQEDLSKPVEKISEEIYEAKNDLDKAKNEVIDTLDNKLDKVQDSLESTLDTVYSVKDLGFSFDLPSDCMVEEVLDDILKSRDIYISCEGSLSESTLTIASNPTYTGGGFGHKVNGIDFTPYYNSYTDYSVCNKPMRLNEYSLLQLQDLHSNNLLSLGINSEDFKNDPIFNLPNNYYIADTLSVDGLLLDLNGTYTNIFYEILYNSDQGKEFKDLNIKFQNIIKSISCN